jgi:O-methyltransferase
MILLFFCLGVFSQDSSISSFWFHMRDHYLTIAKNALTGDIIETPSVVPQVRQQPLAKTYNARERNMGLDWPLYGYTMIGTKRMDSLQRLLIHIVDHNVEGDFIECGVWRGGASIFARLVWNSYHQNHRVVHVADSFSGLPPSASFLDPGVWDQTPFLEVSLEEVKRHFAHFELADAANVKFIKGFFNDSLPVLRRERSLKLALLRLDGDMYESCADIMANLYDRVSVGGAVVVDDWFGFPCKSAIESFFSHHQQALSVERVDSLSVFFFKHVHFAVDPAWYSDFLKTRTKT